MTPTTLHTSLSAIKSMQVIRSQQMTDLKATCAPVEAIEALRVDYNSMLAAQKAIEAELKELEVKTINK